MVEGLALSSSVKWTLNGTAKRRNFGDVEQLSDLSAPHLSPPFFLFIMRPLDHQTKIVYSNNKASVTVSLHVRH